MGEQVGGEGEAVGRERELAVILPEALFRMSLHPIPGSVSSPTSILQ